MFHRNKVLTLLLPILLTGMATTASAQVMDNYQDVTDERLLNPEDENWLMFRRSYDGWGFSPLNQINRDNVGELELAWTLSTGLTEGHQSPPIVNNGIMFITTPLNQILAIDAATGEGLWQYTRQLPFDIALLHPTNRGVALYEDKVYIATSDANLVALDARTGEVVWDQSIENYATGYYITMAPLAVNGKIMVGVSGGERGIRGFITALDAETGEQAWKTYTIPAPGEFGNDTWPEGAWETGGAPAWVTGTYDPDLNITYWGTGNPGPWVGESRPGDNLYANSVLALDADSGELRGYHQYHWNGSWDWDEVSAPLLIDVERDGETISALVHPGRNGYLWTLEREADAINYVDAKPYVYQNVFTSIDPVTGRPEYDMDHKPGMGKSAQYCPSLSGGKNWPPAAYSPQTGLLYFSANENYCTTLTGAEQEYRPGQNYMGVDGIQAGLRDGADHFGELQAWDMNTGEQVWKKEFEKANWGPVLATGGDLVFVGGTADRFFRAFDATNGDLLWEQRTNSGITGVPTSFEVDGVQYIAVQSGWGVDAMRMQAGIDNLLGEKTIVPHGGVVWVFRLKQ